MRWSICDAINAVRRSNPHPQNTFTKVGSENLRPFVLDVGLMCELGKEEEGAAAPAPDMIDSWCQITPKECNNKTFLYYFSLSIAYDSDMSICLLSICLYV